MTGNPPRLSRKAAAPKAGIVHLGLGAFFRSHGAQVVEDAVKARGGDWGIVGVSLRSPGMRNKLAPQGNAISQSAATKGAKPPEAFGARTGDDNAAIIVRSKAGHRNPAQAPVA